MGDVIEIKLSTDLETSSLNKLRYRMELAKWRERWREAEAKNDYRAMDELNRKYEYLGLP